MDDECNCRKVQAHNRHIAEVGMITNPNIQVRKSQS
jgi:hypothetical protein